MALFVESEIRNRAQIELRKPAYSAKSADRVLLEVSRSYPPLGRPYDIFLSHSYKDAQLIVGMKATLEDLFFTVYVDWIDDPQLDRSQVTVATADKIRERLLASNTLLYVTSQNAEASKWMPWECGYFDGKREKVAILPIMPTPTGNTWSGREYLGLYPYVVNERGLQIRKNAYTYIDFREWMSAPGRNLQWRNG